MEELPHQLHMQNLFGGTQLQNITKMQLEEVKLVYSKCSLTIFFKMLFCEVEKQY